MIHGDENILDEEGGGVLNPKSFYNDTYDISDSMCSLSPLSVFKCIVLCSPTLSGGIEQYRTVSRFLMCYEY